MEEDQLLAQAPQEGASSLFSEANGENIVILEPREGASRTVLEADGENIVILKPREGETVTEYCRRYRTEHLRRIIDSSEKLDEFALVLESRKRPETQQVPVQEFEQLWIILKEVNASPRRFLHISDLLEPVRRDLIDSLNKQSRNLGLASYLGALGRIGICLGAFGRLMYFEKPPWETFGILGLVISLLETTYTGKTYRRLQYEIKSDRAIFKHIESFYEKSEKLEDAMLNIFPFDITNEFVQDFENSVKHTDGIGNASMKALVKCVLDYAIRKPLSLSQNGESEVHESEGELQAQSDLSESNKSQSENEEMAQCLIRLLRNSKEAAELFYTVRLRRLTSNLLDTRKLPDLNYESSDISQVCFCMSAFMAYLGPLLNKNPTVPMVLVFVPMITSVLLFNDSEQHAGAKQMKTLERHLKASLELLEKLAGFIKERLSDG